MIACSPTSTRSWRWERVVIKLPSRTDKLIEVV